MFAKIIDIVRQDEYNIRKHFIGVYLMDFITANQAAQKWGISQRRVQILCAEGRIDGVFKLGEAWAIPSQAEKPNDSRFKVAKDEVDLK